MALIVSAQEEIDVSTPKYPETLTTIVVLILKNYCVCSVVQVALIVNVRKEKGVLTPLRARRLRVFLQQDIYFLVRSKIT